MKQLNQYAAFAICKLLDIDPTKVSVDNFTLTLEYKTFSVDFTTHQSPSFEGHIETYTV